jgi:DNA-binding protein YbaB
MDDAMDISSRRIRELLEAHGSRTQGATDSVEGIVSVTVDARLQLTSVQLHDKSLDDKRRAEIEKAIVDAVNGARLKALKSATESLTQLQDSADWKAAMDGVFGRKSRGE